METTEVGEQEQLEMFYALVKKPYGDGLLTIVASSKEAAEIKMANCRTFAGLEFTIYTQQELKEKMPGLKIYTYTFVNGTKIERTRIFIAQSMEEAREKLYAAVGKNIEIRKALTKSIF